MNAQVKGEFFVALPKGESAPSDLVKAAIQDCNNWWDRLARDVASTSIRIGQHLIEMQRDCKRADINFGDLFPKTPDDRGTSKLPFSWATGNKLMSIAKNAAITDSSHVRNCLPSDWGSLYELSRVEPKKLSKLIEDGRVNSDMSRPEIKRVVNGAKPKKSVKKRPVKRKALDEDREWDIAKGVFTRIDDPRKRAEELLKLLDDIGLTIDQIVEAA